MNIHLSSIVMDYCRNVLNQLPVTAGDAKLGSLSMRVRIVLALYGNVLTHLGCLPGVWMQYCPTSNHIKWGYSGYLTVRVYSTLHLVTMGTMWGAISVILIGLHLMLVSDTVSAGKTSSSSKCEKSLTTASGSKAPAGKMLGVRYNLQWVERKALKNMLLDTHSAWLTKQKISSVCRTYFI